MEKRKQGRPSLPRNIEEYVVTAAMKNPGMKRLALVAKVEQELKEKGFKPPAKDTMLKLFQKATQPGKEEEKWNVAKSVELGLSPEATADLVEVCIYCLAAGREFTVRQAKWACYLREMIKNRRYAHRGYFLNELFTTSQLYSDRERACEALKLDLDTSDLDIFTSIAPSWEFHTMNMLGTVPHCIAHEVGKNDIPGTNNTPTLWRAMSAGDVVQLDLGIGPFNPYTYPPLEGDTDYVYALLLRFISNGPKWKNMSNEQKKIIALELRDEVKKHKSLVDSITNEGYWETVHWAPPEILSKVGLKIQSIQELKHERPHRKEE